jgi:hypothetical protein
MISSAMIAAGALALGGCMSGPLGGGGMGGPLEAVLGQVLGGSQNNGGSSFQQAAINACGNHASQYGQVSIQDVRQQNNSTLRVAGTVGTNYGRRNFECSFRSDGQITDFDF